MKLLRLQVSGLSLFKDDLDIMFYGTQNISIEDKETMYPLFSNIYLNCATVFIGKNASGKTTILQVLSLALHLLNNDYQSFKRKICFAGIRKSYDEYIFLFKSR